MYERLRDPERERIGLLRGKSPTEACFKGNCPLGEIRWASRTESRWGPLARSKAEELVRERKMLYLGRERGRKPGEPDRDVYQCAFDIRCDSVYPEHIKIRVESP